MAMSSVRVKPLRIADAPVLQSAFAGDDLPVQTIAKWQDCIRRFNRLCELGHWILTEAENPDRIWMVFGLQLVDPTSRIARFHVLNRLQTGHDAALMEQIAELAFFDLDLYGLEWHLAEKELQLWQTCLQALPWQFVARLPLSCWSEKQHRHDNGMIYMLYRPDYPARNSAFVLFRKGVLAITGDQDAITSAVFVHHGQFFSSSWQQEQAEWQGLLDQAGQLKSAASLPGVFADRPYLHREQIPAPVKQAASEAAEYFAGQRRDFSVPLRLSDGSPFQQQVWEQLSQIPYGQTSSYSEIAQMIRPEDRRAGRTLARAVGHACGANPLPLFLPCHRVIGQDGRLTGFSSGLDIKEYLLAHEFMGLK